MFSLDTSFDGGHPAQQPTGSWSSDSNSIGHREDNTLMIEQKLSELSQTIKDSTDKIEGSLGQLDQRVKVLENEVEKIKSTAESVKTKADKNEKSIVSLQKQVKELQKPNRTLSCCKTIGWTMLGGAITVASVVGYDLFVQYQRHLSKEENS